MLLISNDYIKFRHKTNKDYYVSWRNLYVRLFYVRSSVIYEINLVL